MIHSEMQLKRHMEGSSIYFVKLEQVAVLPCLLYHSLAKGSKYGSEVVLQPLDYQKSEPPYLSRMRSTTEGSLSLINEDRSDIEKYRGQQS